MRIIMNIQPIVVGKNDNKQMGCISDVIKNLFLHRSLQQQFSNTIFLTVRTGKASSFCRWGQHMQRAITA